MTQTETTPTKRTRRNLPRHEKNQGHGPMLAIRQGLAPAGKAALPLTDAATLGGIDKTTWHRAELMGTVPNLLSAHQWQTLSGMAAKAVKKLSQTAPETAAQLRQELKDCGLKV